MVSVANLDLEEVAQLHKEGYSLRELGKTFSCDRKALARALRDSGIKTAGPGTAGLPSEVKRLSDREWGFIAGLIEGDGSITCHSTDTPHYRCWISVSQVDPRPLYWLQERLGGKVYIRKKRRGEERRVSGQWVSTRQRSTQIILIKILPLLVGKRRQAVVALKVLRAKGDYETQAYYARMLKRLKHQEWIKPELPGRAK